VPEHQPPDNDTITHHVDHTWDADVLPALHDYIRIPNLSPNFDPDWEQHGHMARAVELVRAWCADRPIPGLTTAVHNLPGRTPVLVFDVPASPGFEGDDVVLLYGHLDKQPPMSGWRDGLDPFEPVREGELLYGRGGADDGYAAFATLTAIEALETAGGVHARCVLLVEASEESGSPDLPPHVEALSGALGSPSLVIALDSFCATYDRLWLTTSLRGLAGVTVTVRVLEEGVHSGAAGGVVPSSFRILRVLLDRIEDAATGEVLLPELYVDVPADREAQIVAAAAELGDTTAGTYPLVATRMRDGDPAEQLRAKTWEPALGVIGMDGIPPTASAGNVLRPFTTAKLSCRLPPTCDPQRAVEAVVRTLTAEPPNGAAITVDVDDVGPGWNAPPLAPWLDAAANAASTAAFGQPCRAMGEGGTIPFMGMLGEKFPDAQFVITGVLGPGSNAHGPNEFLHVPMAKGVTAAVAHLLHLHATR
jgi:acetylornithine deacetylase/succinyl-diaminopimelate desuccinylase-like protein